jgi:acetyl esterase/lipase
LILALACIMPQLTAAASASAPASEKRTLTQARTGFSTKIVRTGERHPAAPVPPKGVFDLIKFDSPVGKLAAYVSSDPGDGKKHPAIVWITGGDSNSIGEMWEPKPRSNDQSAAQYRKAGVITMYPTLRGGNDNPGRREGFYGEVDDVIAAAKHLASLPYVDPDRIYLGGHSTGGTLVMLVAQSTNRFRATFAFGPVTTPLGYGDWAIFHAPDNEKEAQLRSPILWLDSVRTPLYLIEGGKEGNIRDLAEIQRANKNPLIRIIPVLEKNHFNVLAPANELIAKRIIAQPVVAADNMLTIGDAASLNSR